MAKSFQEMNALVNTLFEHHSPDNEGLFGASALAFQSERNALLVAHGWEPATFARMVEEFASED